MATDLKEPPFDPRLAALTHAATATVQADRAKSTSDVVIAEATNAITCALVYVGDQISRQTVLAAVLAGSIDDPAGMATHINDVLGQVPA